MHSLTHIFTFALPFVFYVIIGIKDLQGQKAIYYQSLSRQWIELDTTLYNKIRFLLPFVLVSCPCRPFFLYVFCPNFYQKDTTTDELLGMFV